MSSIGRVDIRRVLAMSDELDKQLRLRLAEWSEGWRSGHAAGFAEGWQAAEANVAADWASIARPVAHHRSPAAEGWERRVVAADSADRRAAWAHWRAFAERALAERPELRTDAQTAAVEFAGRQGGAP